MGTCSKKLSLLQVPMSQFHCLQFTRFTDQPQLKLLIILGATVVPAQLNQSISARDDTQN